MFIRFHRVKQLAIISAIIIIPLICLNLLQVSFHKDSQAVSQSTVIDDQLDQVINQKTTQQLSEGIGFFSEYRLERERIRGKQTELLKDLASNPDNAQKIRDEAALKLVKLTETAEKEMHAETLIKSKGIRDCAVIIESAGVSVILDMQDLSMEQKAAILELCSKATECKADKISINIRRNER